LLAVLVGGGLSPLGAQSLGDVARKEEDRRKQVQTAAKVYTNKDLGSVPPSSVTPPPAGSGDTTEPSGKDPAKTPDAAKADDSASSKNKDKDNAKDPAYWAGRQKALQAALDHDSSFADALQVQINALTTDFVNRDDPAQRALIERNRLKALAELDQLKKQIAADKKAIADFQEEARRAAVPPGWLR
jgi:hypothetical protein